jgi:outer membrane usher protein
MFAQQEYEAPVPFMLGDMVLGEVRVRLKDEKAQFFDKKSLLPILKGVLKKSQWAPLENKGDWIKVEELPIKLVFNPESAMLEATIPTDMGANRRLDAIEDLRDIYAGQALATAPFGGAINYRLEKAWGADELGGETFSTYFDSFINMGGVVLENQANYLDNPGQAGWFRGDTRLVKDFQPKRVRVEAGDVYPSGFGFMPARPVGGVHVARNFTLDPYRVPFPQGQGRFTLQTRSRVRTFVNGVQIKDETLPAGNYDLRDVPLINGLNTVLVETTDELGNKRVYEFRLPTSVGLLRANEWNFSLSHGKPFLDTTFRRSYNEEGITSGYVQYGFNRSFSMGGYAQAQEDFTLGGTEAGLATNIGNFFLGGAASRDGDRAAGAGSGTWQFQNLGTRLFSSYTLTVRHERYGDGFQTQNDTTPNLLKSQWHMNVTVPIKELLTLSLGGTHGDVRDEELANRKSWDATLNIRAWTNLNLSFFMSRTRDEQKRWNDIAYMFFTWTFDNASHFLTGFHDAENNINRLTAVRDNGNRLYSPRLTAIAEEGPQKDALEAEGFMPTPMADVGGRIVGAQFEGDEDTHSRGALRLSSALVFAYQEGNFGLGFSRPVPNSFVLFDPSPELKKQKIALRSSSPYTEGESGPLGEITFTNLLPYQFREIQLDPTGLDDGTSLVQEKFVVYPTYRSAHLISLKDKGTVVLTGTMLGADGKPLGLAVGDVSGKPFFTTREGRFFIEGLDPGAHILKIDGYQPSTLKVDPKARGIKDIGSVGLIKEEE